MSDVERFEFAFAPSYERAARPFGITPKSAWVSIDDVLFDARFGHWRVSTPLANITRVVERVTAGCIIVRKFQGVTRLVIDEPFDRNPASIGKAAHPASNLDQVAQRRSSLQLVDGRRIHRA